MTRQGSPLRFLALVTGSWVTIRIVMLWPQGAPPSPVSPATELSVTKETPSPIQLPPAAKTLPLGPAEAWARPLAIAQRTRPAPVRQRDPAALPGMIPVRAVEPISKPVISLAPMAMPAPGRGLPSAPKPHQSPSRWSGSFWLIARDGRGVGASLSGSQLGGSQAGVRLAYALWPARRVSIVGRVASPLGGGGQEGAIGLEWQPTRLPVRLVAEQRIGINGAAGGPSVALVGGVGPLPLWHGFRLESYGQAGIIGRGGVIGYADGAVRINRQVAMIGGTPIDLGGGGWGAIQPGAARLDLGPSIGARLPIGRQRYRVSIDWRQRVAGDARPGSGPAPSIGTDF